MRISDWSSDVCSSDLEPWHRLHPMFGRKAVGMERADIAHSKLQRDILLGREASCGLLCQRRRRHEPWDFAVQALAIFGHGVPAARFHIVDDRPDAGEQGLVVPLHGTGEGHKPLLGHKALPVRSEEHTSELQSLMRISSAVFCLKKKNKTPPT